MHDTLQQVFGYPQFRLGQEETVNAVLAGRSAAAISLRGRASPCVINYRRYCCRT